MKTIRYRQKMPSDLLLFSVLLRANYCTTRAALTGLGMGTLETKTLVMGLMMIL